LHGGTLRFSVSDMTTPRWVPPLDCSRNWLSLSNNGARRALSATGCSVGRNLNQCDIVRAAPEVLFAVKCLARAARAGTRLPFLPHRTRVFCATSGSALRAPWGRRLCAVHPTLPRQFRTACNEYRSLEGFRRRAEVRHVIHQSRFPPRREEAIANVARAVVVPERSRMQAARRDHAANAPEATTVKVNNTGLPPPHCARSPPRCGLVLYSRLITFDPLGSYAAPNKRLPSTTTCYSSDGDALLGRDNRILGSEQSSISRTDEVSRAQYRHEWGSELPGGERKEISVTNQNKVRPDLLRHYTR